MAYTKEKGAGHPYGQKLRLTYWAEAGNGGHTVYAYIDYVIPSGGGSVNIAAATNTDDKHYISIDGTRVGGGQKATKASANSVTRTCPYSGDYVSKWISHSAAKTVTISYACACLNSNYSLATVTDSVTLDLAALYTKMGAPTIKTSSASVKRGQSVTISWSAGSLGNSSVKGYTVQYSTDNSNWSAWYSGTGTSKTFTMPAKTSVGTKYYFRAYQSSNAGSSFDSSWSSSISTSATSNKPSVSLSSKTPDGLILPSTGGNATITIAGTNNAGTGTLKYYYKQGSGSWISSTSNSYTFSNITSQTTCQYCVNDGYEDSEYGSITFSINTKPVINDDFSFSTENYTPGSPTSFPLAKNYTLNGTYNKTPTLYYIQLKTSENSDMSNCQIINNKISFSSKPISQPISNLITTRGIFYQLGLIIYDGIEYSDIAWDNTKTYLYPYAPLAPTEISIVKTNNYTPQIGYLDFGEQAINWKLPNNTTDRCKISRIQVNRLINDTNVTEIFTDNTGIATTCIDTISNSNTRGSKVTYKVILTDEQQLTSEISINANIANEPSLQQSEIIIGSTRLKPKTDIVNNIKPQISVKPKKEVDIKNYTARLVIKQGNNNTIINMGNFTDDDWNISSGSGCWLPFNDGEHYTSYLEFINYLWKSQLDYNNTKLNKNNSYTTCNFQVMATDNYNLNSEWISSKDFVIDFREAPNIIGAKLGIAYYSNNYDSNHIEYIDTNKNVAIGGEYVVLECNWTDENATDDGGNLETIFTPMVQISSNNGVTWSTLQMNKDVSITDLLSTRLYYKISEPLKDTVYIFRVAIIDSTELMSDYFTLSNQKLTVVSINNPTCSLSNDFKVDNNRISVVVNSVEDGGNWENNRVNPNITSSIGRLTLEVSTSPNFTTLENFTTDTTNGMLNNKSVGISGSQDKYYIRVKIEYDIGDITAGAKRTISSYSQILVYYLTKPAVAYRSKSLGLFVKNYDENTDQSILLKINRSSQNRKNIVIGSEAKLSIEDEIEGDESIVAIEKFVIDGGTY